MTHWQPIETAPKDGTAFLAYVPSRSGYVARQDMPVLHCRSDGYFELTNSGHVYSVEPTHWQPLPDPPE